MERSTQSAPSPATWVGLRWLLSTLLLLSSAACVSSAPQGSIGAILYKDPTSGRVTIEQAPASMTGAQAGLEPGDEILAVDGTDVRSLSREALQHKLRGTLGTHVELTIARGERLVHVVVTRGPYKREPAEPR